MIKIVQDVDQAIEVMRDAGKWLEDSGKHPSDWWKSQNLTRDVLFKYAQPEEFFTAFVDNKPAAAMILTLSQEAQDWSEVDGGHSPKALYIHWLSVHRDFAGQGLPRRLVDFATQKARASDIKLLRLDTNADEIKLRKLYEGLGFHLVTILQEVYQRTAFYQKLLS